MKAIAQTIPRSATLAARSALMRSGVMKQRKAMGGATPGSDRPGVGDLYRRYAAWLQAALRRRFGAETADDLVQETYLRLISCETEIEVRHPKALLMRVSNDESCS